MTIFEQIKNMSVDEFAEWLDEHGRLNGSPWLQWWEETYCNQCPVEHGYLPDYTGMHTYQVPTEFAWCELHDKCKFFLEMDETPDNKDIIKMWLESKVKT